MAKPVHEVRIGMIKASIWKKKTQSGPRHTVALVRLFRNGDRWQESTRFGRDDLPVLRMVVDQAHNWIFENTQRD